MPYHVAFDVSHKPRGRIDENLTELRDYLKSNDFISYNYLEVPITEESLVPYDILVFVCPDFARISSFEINAIVNWVKNSGGGILLLSHAGGDRGRGSNLSEISEQFGIAFENDQVLDEKVNLGIENIPLVSAFNIPHPITADIGTICYRSGSSLSVIGSGAFSIADSNETSEPFSCPLMCVSEYDNGRVCCIGSYELFRDKVGGGFQCNDNPQLALNIFKWLISDFRMELRVNQDLPAPIPQPTIIPQETTEVKDSSIPQASREKRSIDIDFSMKISKKSELIELLKIFQNQINTVAKTIDKLIEKTIESEGEIFELNDSDIKYSSESSQEIELDEITDTQLTELSEKPKKQEIEDIFPEEDKTLTALPPKPNILQKDDSELKPPPKLKTKEMSKNELKDEKEGLKTKISSVQDLLKFIDKKHSSGKLDDDEYVKRSKKLQKDLKKTKKRMDIIDKLLEK